MKIAFLGNFRVPYTSESHYKRSLIRLGHEVITLQESESIDFNRLPEILSADMFFWVHTHGWQTPGLDYVLGKAREFMPIVGYHLDLWKGLRREVDVQNDSYWKWVSHFFTCDKSFVPDLQALGIQAYYLPAGVFDEECYIAEPNLEKYPHEIIFTGSKQYHVEWPYRVQLIDWLQKTYGNRFKLHGREPGKDYEQIRGHELNTLYASAKIVIGDTLCKGFNYPDYFSDRLFEVPGRGGFMIFPFIPGVEEMYQLPKNLDLQGKFLNTDTAELITYPFNNFEYLKYLIDYFLQNETEREAIRKRGHERVKAEHTYMFRLDYILKTVFTNENTNA